MADDTSTTEAGTTEAGTTEAGTTEAGTTGSSTTKARTTKAATAKTAPAKAATAKAATAKAATTEAAAGRGLKLHHLRPAPGAHKAKTRVGRGEASKGKTAGRGTKGTKARYQVPLGFEGGQMPLHRRVPKLKGFSNKAFGTTYQVVNLSKLAELYADGGDVTPESMVAKGAARKGELVKVLGTGEVTVALRVTAHAFSASARDKIQRAGGTVTELR
jgi:large subunit ribosomal protein L15